MNELQVSFQEVALQVRLIAAHWLPILAVAAMIVGVFLIGQFFGKFMEQRSILRHLPEVIRQELLQRDEKLVHMEKAYSELQERYRHLVAMVRASRVQVSKLGESLQLALSFEPNRKLLTEVKR